MLPSIHGSTMSHHNRQRNRNFSGNINQSIPYSQHRQHAQLYERYYRGTQKVNQTLGRSDNVYGYNKYQQESKPPLPPRPRSADPSPHRTASRIESLSEMHGGPLPFSDAISSSTSGFPPIRRHLIGGSSSNLPMMTRTHHSLRGNPPPYSSQISYHNGGSQSLVPMNTIPTDLNQSPNPHHHHQVLYVCHGQCTGPRCDFSKSTRQMQSLVYLDPSQKASQGTFQPVSHFRSEVVETAPSAFRKLDKKRATISQMKEILATKLENKNRQRMSRKQRNMFRDQRGNHRKSTSSNTIERDVNVAESLNRQVYSRQSQASDVSGDLSLRGSTNTRCFFSLQRQCSKKFNFGFYTISFRFLFNIPVKL